MGEAQKQMIKLTDADKAFAMLMIAPVFLARAQKERAAMKVETPPPDGVLSNWWLRAKSGISLPLCLHQRHQWKKEEK